MVRGKPQWDFPVSLLASDARCQTHLCKSRHLNRYKEKCLQKSEEDWSKTVPHFARTQPRTRGCERVHTTLPSHMIPLALPLLHRWARAPLQWMEKSVRQVLIRENQNVLRVKTPNHKPQLLGLLPRQQSNPTVQWWEWEARVSSSIWRASPYQDSYVSFSTPVTPPCCGLTEFLHTEMNYVASVGSFYLNLGTV